MDVIRAPDEAAGGKLGAALLTSALAMVDDPAEARALVAQTLEAAREGGTLGAPLGQAAVFRLLRQAYHSIERSRPRRRMRDATVTALAMGGAPPEPSQDG